MFKVGDIVYSNTEISFPKYLYRITHINHPTDERYVLMGGYFYEVHLYNLRLKKNIIIYFTRNALFMDFSIVTGFNSNIIDTLYDNLGGYNV